MNREIQMRDWGLVKSPKGRFRSRRCAAVPAVASVIRGRSQPDTLRKKACTQPAATVYELLFRLARKPPPQLNMLT